MHYTATIAAPLPPREAARRIVDDLEQWWSTRVDRRADGFTVRFNASHATFRFDPGGTENRFAWTCTDAHMIMNGVDDPAEWAGTRLVWTVAATEAGSAITLTHQGLTPQIACFDICRAGWQHFFELSLRDHLNGAPAAPETSPRVA